METITARNNCSFKNNKIKQQIFNFGIHSREESPTKVWFNIQEYVSTFTGRSEDINKIINALNENKKIAICGLGGIGKTELTRYYACKYKDLYNGNVVWINAEIKDSIKNSFQNLAIELHIPIVQNGCDRLLGSIINDVFEKLNKIQCLIVYDNAINFRTIKQYLPSNKTTNVNVIITSQCTKWNTCIKTINLDVLTPDDANEFLKKYLIDDENDVQQLKTLAIKLQYLPLALQQAVAYINYKVHDIHEKFTVEMYIKEFERKRLFHFSYENQCAFPNSFDNSYDKTIFTTISLTVDIISKESTNLDITLDILHICSYVAPDSIPKFLFVPLQDNEEIINSSLYMLIKYSLLREFRTENEFYYSIHRLVQVSFRYLKNAEGVCPNTLKKSLFLTTREELRRSAHCASILDFITSRENVHYEFYFNECPNKDILIFHLGYYNHFDAMNYLLNVVTSELYDIGIQGAIENGSLKIVKLLYDKSPMLDKCNFYLAKSAGFGSIPLIRYFIEKSGNINYLFQGKYSPLSFAVLRNQGKIIQFLIKQGSLINRSEPEYISPMYLAVMNGNIDILKILKENGGSINFFDEKGYTLMHHAAHQGHLNIIIYLKEQGHEINCFNKINTTPLYSAALNGHEDVVHYLVENQAFVSFRENVGRTTALYAAALAGHKNIVEYLHKKGADINIQNYQNQTPLLIAAYKGYESIVRYLIENYCSRDIYSINGESALFVAAQNGHLSIVKYLHENGFDVNTSTKEMLSPLFIACVNGHFSVVKFLKEQGANLHQLSITKCSPLFAAAQNGHVEIVRYLFENGCDINILTGDCHFEVLKLPSELSTDIFITYSRKFSVLHIAAQHGYTSIIKFFIENNIDIDTSTDKKDLPLHLAALNGHISTAQLLIDNGNDLNKKNVLGMTPLHCAASNGQKNMAELLIENGCDIDERNELGYTPFLIAVEKGHFELVQFFCEKSCNINAKSKEGYNALYIAVAYDHETIVPYLLQRDINRNISDKDGFTLLHIATMNNNESIVRFLIESGFCVNIETNNRITPVTLALALDLNNIVQLYEENGCHINVYD